MRIPASSSLLGRPFDERLARLGLISRSTFEDLPPDAPSELAALGAGFLAHLAGKSRKSAKPRTTR